ncbi:MAG: acyl-CoA thioesterase [Desulfonatronovibrio sp.]|nr:acyl-CoA thioesterase [Desulfovibrionales bacterium]
MKTPSKEFPLPQTWHYHRVSYGETDAMGVVYYANYLHWFEMARGTYIRERGISYVKIEEKKLFLPVIRAECKYFQPARFDDIIYVRAAISKWGRASFIFDYEVTSEDRSRVLTIGQTGHACVNELGKPVRVPEWLKKMCSN